MLTLVFKSVAEAADRPYSHVIVTTKAVPEIITNSTLLEPLIRISANSPHPLPTFVILQNGLSVERDLYEALVKLGKGTPNIISTALWIGTNLLDGNIIDHSHPERLYIGIYRPEYQGHITNTPEETAILKGFADLLPGESVVHVLDEVQRVKFRKFFWNAVFGCCSTLTGHPLPAFFLDPVVEAQVVPTLRNVMLEILAIGCAMGFDEEALPSSVTDETIGSTAKLHKEPNSTHRPSMLVDLESRRPLELDVVIGELVRKAKELQVDIPRLELIYSLLSVMQHQLTGSRR